MKIRIPSVLRSYTNDEKYVSIEGSTLLEVLDNLDRQFPGIKFRFIDEHNQIREHMNLFFNGKLVKNIDFSVEDGDELFIAQSLSGG